MTSSSSTRLNQLLEQKREDILELAAKYGARNVRIFGSVARGEAGPDSDVDFLVELEPERSLLDRVALIQDLSDLLGCQVDVANEKGLREPIRQRVLREAVPL
ncbi:MAG: nucleotidyltransferase family protein [Chroococcidiopsidaceae cyanobacterium CP_BM_RX_35]|nr:nucleotidyltransferase family protein [Chroococcidiopsidaceae cyanobacterium CP_BM_RX_35]